MSDCETSEPCHDQPCDGVDEVQRLLPPGNIWDLSNGTQTAASFLALGDIKSAVNLAICQEWLENDPCQSVRLFDVWASIYSFPKECADQDRLCDWVEIMEDQECPIGSIAFYRRVIEFVAPDKEITLDVNQPGLLAGQCQVDDPANPSRNVLCITAPADCFEWEASDSTAQDGTNDRCYYIPEIECLRYYVFPFASLGYKTKIQNPDGWPIYNVPDSAEGVKPDYFYNPKPTC